MNAAVKKFDFEVGVYRPPSEGGSHSLLVRLTRNCPWNRCTFCGMYKGEKFEIRPVFPAPGTPLHDQYKRGDYEMLTPREQLNELKLMIEGLDVGSRVCFDHAANYWRNPRGGLLFSQSYEGYPFPEAKPILLELIDAGLKFDSTRPMHFRL